MKETIEKTLMLQVQRWFRNTEGGVSWFHPLIVTVGLFSTAELHEKYKIRNNLIFAWFFSVFLFGHYWMKTYFKLMKKLRTGCPAIKMKVTSLCMRYALIVNYPSKLIEVKTPLKTTKVKLPVTSCVNPPKHRKISYNRNITC